MRDRAKKIEWENLCKLNKKYETKYYTMTCICDSKMKETKLVAESIGHFQQRDRKLQTNNTKKFRTDLYEPASFG